MTVKRENTPKITPITTADGSLSCFNAETREAYHNKAGAYTEALENFVLPSGVLQKAVGADLIRILDPCFGLGYNTWVLLDELLKLSEPPRQIYITAIENEPDILEIVPEALNSPLFHPLKAKIPALWHNTYYRTQEGVSQKSGSNTTPVVFSVQGCSVTFELFLNDLRACVPALKGPYDVVLHDAFSAQRMPELWTVDLFRQYYRLLAPVKGSVITYSSAGAVRGGLVEAGFKLGKTRALGEKNGGTVAYLSECLPPGSEALNKTEEYYLETRAGIPYRDYDLMNSAAMIITSRKREQHDSQRPSGAETRSKLLQL